MTPLWALLPLLLSPQVDPWLDGGITLGASLGWVSLYLERADLASPACPCDPDEVNAIDALAFEIPWERGEAWADRSVAVALAVPLAALALSGEEPRAINEGVLLTLESVALTGLLTQAAKGTISRPYPYMYGEGISEGQRRDGINFESMWSGHTAVPMAAAVTSAALLSRYRVRWAKWAWILGPSLALLSGGLQVTAQNHFPSDVLVGALIGGGIGYANVALRPDAVAE